jgi:meromycolic acid enoyl-[acyl-carrier-protein] reductase
MLLAGKRILVTGVLTERSIAFAVAREAQAAGAEVILTSYGRFRRLTRRAARALPDPSAEILELDVTNDEDFARLGEDLGPVDGALHAIAWSPPSLIRDGFFAGTREEAMRSFEVSAYSYKRLAETLVPLMPGGGSLLAVTFAPQIVWPGYDWMGVLKGALESINRYLASHLGRARIRANVIAAGPIRSVASEVFSRFDVLCDAWEAQAPLGWDSNDPTPVGRVACLLLSDWADSMTGGVIHADGGYHALARPADCNFATPVDSLDALLAPAGGAAR